MSEAYKEKIQRLKRAVLEYLSTNHRHYGDLNRMEQSVEDLAQALNTRLDQLLLCVEDCGAFVTENPRDRLANRLMETASKLTRGGRVDSEMVDDFGRALDAFDLAADLKRQAETVKDSAETAALKHKRDRF